MPVVAAVEYGAPLDVRMPVREMALTLRLLAGRRCRTGTAQATEGEPRPSEILAQADVEGDVRGVCVHVEAKVLAVAILHHEGMVVVRIAALPWEEQPGEG